MSETKGFSMAATEKVKGAVVTARPVVERLATDEEFQRHVKSAFDSARTIYDELFVGAAPKTAGGARVIAGRLATDKAVQDEVRRAVEELRLAGERAKGKQSHKARNALILTGIVVGILYNPATGPETRRWLKEKVFGPEETFEYEA
jgi:hypothetical protein